MDTDVPDAVLYTSRCNTTDWFAKQVSAVLPPKEKDRCRTESWEFLRWSGTVYLHEEMHYDKD